MKARIAYPLLFLLPSAMAAFLSAFVAGGMGAGILWLFVYGDNTWPQGAGDAVMAFAAIVAVAVLAVLLFASYSFGKAREASGGVAKRHVAVAIVISVLLPAVALLHQWQVGNIG
jgi:membrane-anchored protein YejM (alkaline phosphatase superfamily)